MSKIRHAGKLRPMFKFSSAPSRCYKINNMPPASTIDHSIKYTCTKKLFYISPEDGSNHTLATMTLGFLWSFVYNVIGSNVRLNGRPPHIFTLTNLALFTKSLATPDIHNTIQEKQSAAAQNAVAPYVFLFSTGSYGSYLDCHQVIPIFNW